MTSIDEIPEALSCLQTSRCSTAPVLLEEEGIYMSLMWCEGKMSVSIYDSESTIIHVLLDTLESDPFENIQLLLYELQPSVVVTSAKLDDRLMKLVKNYCNEEYSMYDQSKVADESTEEDNHKPVLDLLSSLEYGYETSKRRILAINLPGISREMSDMEKKFFLTSLLPFHCLCAVRSLGGLLRYLQKKRVGVGLESPETHTPISGIETFTLKNVLFMERSCLESLQIFHKVNHPSVLKSSSKEGLSLFGVLNRTMTSAGRKLLRSWFHRPTSEPTIVKRRHDAINFFLNTRNAQVTRGIGDYLKRIGNVTRLLSRLRTAKLSINDWQSLLRTAQNALRIGDVCRSVAGAGGNEHIPEVLVNVVHYFTNDLVTIVSMITNVIDVDASKAEGCVCIKAGVSNTLDELRRNYARLPIILSQMADMELDTYTDYITSCQVVYLRRIGYLLFIYKTEEMKQCGDLAIPGIEFIAESADTVYYKTPVTAQLDKEFGDLLEDISDQQVIIGNDLQNLIADHSSVLLDVSKLSSELDCLLSFATVAKEFDYVQPILSNRKGIKVVKGRHPLQEHTVSLFVPNDIQLSDGDGSLQILTGPNASGKSVYLKQIGLIAYMTHIGSFVPADSAEVGRITRIFTKIRNIDSIVSGMSSFASDLAQMSQAVNKATGESLVLIDEFGKGTSTVDGQSLLHACLSYWLEMPDPPLVVTTTHFYGITKSFTSPTTSVRFLTMETMEAADADGKIAFLYQLVDGFNDHINSSDIALTTGIHEEIVTRGHEVASMIRSDASINQFDRESTSTYQLKCSQVAERAAVADFDDPVVVKNLLDYVKKMLDCSGKNTF